jgi:hypothetical protein
VLTAKVRKTAIVDFDSEEIRLTRYLWWQFEESKAQATAGKVDGYLAWEYDGELIQTAFSRQRRDPASTNFVHWA